MPVIPLPEGYTWGFVTARSIHAMADTTEDFDRFPEARGSNGRVTFRPHLRFRVHEENPTAFVHYEVVEARMRNGTLIDAEGLPGIYLIAGYYSVSFNIEGGSIQGFDIEVTDEHTRNNPLDLVTAAPVVIPPGYVEVVRISDRIRAEEAAQRAENTAQHLANTADQTARQAAEAATTEARGYSEAAAGSAAEAANTAQAMDAVLDEFVTEGVPLATTSEPGLMSAPDKTKLDGVSEGAINQAEVEDLIPDLQGYASEQYVDDHINSIDIPSVEGLASESYVDNAVDGLPVATGTSNGLMSAPDKTKLDGVSDGAINEQEVESLLPSVEGLASESYVDNAVDGLPLATTSEPGLMSAPDKTKLDGVSDIPSVDVNTSGGTRVTVAGQVVSYDSGWRNISSMMNSYIQGELHIRRTLNEIRFRFLEVSSTDTSSEGPVRIVPSIPSGWRPDYRQVFEVPSSDSTRYGTVITYVPPGMLNIAGEIDFSTRESITPFGSSSFSGDVILPTDNALPTSLIGTPV